MSPRAAKILGAGLFAGVAALAVLATLGGAGTSVPGSVAERGPAGRRAALALLEALGFEASAFTEPPGALPAAPALHWLPRPPLTLGLERADQREGPPEGRALLGELHDPRAWLRAVDAGATLVVPVQEATEAFLVETLELTDFAGALAPGEAPLEALEIELSDGSRARALWPAGERFAGLAPGGPLEPALVATDGRVLALELPLGRGRVVALGWDGFLDNERLSERDHALLLVRLVEEWARGAPVRFDEYALGRWAPPGTGALALSPRLRWTSLHLSLLLVLVVWRSAWSWRFPRDPAPLEQLSPIARARSAAALTERARRFDLAGAALLEGRARALARRERLARTPDGARPLDALLARLDPEVAQRERARLEEPVRTHADLEALDRALDELALRLERRRRAPRAPRATALA